MSEHPPLAAQSLATLAGALAPLVFRPATPRLGRTDPISIAASLADLETGWAAYWLGELGLPVEPTRVAWRRAVVLQSLYEAGVLRDGGGLAWSDPDVVLEDYLRGLGFDANAGPAAIAVSFDHPPPSPAVVRRGGVLAWVSTWSAQAEVRAGFAALESAGWAPWPLHMDRLDHPLDGYLRPEAVGNAGGPDLARERGAAPERDFLFIAVRRD